MKKIESSNFKYTQKNVVVGNKVRSVIMIDRKPGDKVEQNEIAITSHKTVTIEKRRCSGCSRKRRG